MTLVRWACLPRSRISLQIGVTEFTHPTPDSSKVYARMRIDHPRAALVRHIFQRHVRGSMWAAFTPRRELEAGRLVITGADVGFEG